MDGAWTKQGRNAALGGIFAEGRNAKLKNRHGGRFLSQFRFYPLRGCVMVQLCAILPKISLKILDKKTNCSIMVKRICNDSYQNFIGAKIWEKAVMVVAVLESLAVVVVEGVRHLFLQIMDQILRDGQITTLTDQAIHLVPEGTTHPPRSSKLKFCY
jgi:hypothetical protein